MEIDIDYEHNYEYDKPKDRTKARLEQIKEMGLTEVGIGQFGIEGLMSGLYIERVWGFTDEEWDDYLEWIETLKKRSNE